jgi:Mn2+/Fe2+ NRAMP family transporter
MAVIVSEGTVTTSSSEAVISYGDSGTAFYVATLEASAMANGDSIDVWFKSAGAVGGTVMPAYYATYAHAQGTASLKVTPPMPAAGTLVYSIKRTAGSDRSYAWALWKL